MKTTLFSLILAIATISYTAFAQKLKGTIIYNFSK